MNIQKNRTRKRLPYQQNIITNQQIIKSKNIKKKSYDPIPFVNKNLLLKFYKLSSKKLKLYKTMKETNIPNNIIEASKNIPREFFLPYDKVDVSYENRPIPIGFGQTVSQPSLVCQMIHKLDLQPRHNVLEIGTGIGYNASILSLLSRYVTTVEIVIELVKRAKTRILFCQQQGILKNNISLIHGDGNLGYKQNAPYDRIIVTCGSYEIPIELTNQLAEGGLMVIPVKEKLANGEKGEFINIVRKINGGIIAKKDISVRFVPFIKKNIISKKVI